MREYPEQIPSANVSGGDVRTIPANPPRRRPNAPLTRRAVKDDTRAAKDDTPVTRRATKDNTRAAKDDASVTRRATKDNTRAAKDDASVTRRAAKDAAPVARTRVERRRTRLHTRRRRAERLVGHVITASAALLLILFVLPFLFTSDDARPDTLPLSTLARKPDAFPAPETEVPAPDEPESVSEPVAAPVPEEPFTGVLDDECTLRVLDKSSGEVSVMPMSEYLVCVLRGEMPGSFELEALKSQAVAARTYTRYMMRSGGKHKGVADICTSPACCQAYLSAASAKKKWGYLPDDEEQKIRNAVIETDGQIMLYDDAPILAVFHSSSAGLTRTSADVWSGDMPYLQPVVSPEPADSIPNYYSRVEFTTAKLRDKLHSAFPKANLSGSVSEWLTDAERDDAGSISTVYVGGIKTQGSKVRSALGLRSACFTWEIGDGVVVFYVTGHGHGVGLSQYGANQMALDGANYREILTHYYTGVRINGYVPPEQE